MIYYLLGINILLFLLMGVDKFKAKAGLWRVSERVLLGLGIIGGGFGGFIGGRIFRHKIRKIYFQIVWVLGMIVALLLFFKIK
ncbi:Uncharacterized membrane protein YsdA, DUF1294 family [Pilibacter termitis]|uniref:Uncharacterized membrane protein YsdA, DUF1294 family n=1 Tax=Pilibacter termitis TaxID=263852 RepID=A0A1T4M714_9ENTE|nr:DUF1294 domain-containing protein [Pilibacter termitis]SJZ62514.1 Uncharacterized membrane protein YsdA, DUF1294 family [Pilibacter termitis]